MTDVDVWWVDLRRPVPRPVLSFAEGDRAQRFRSVRARSAFVITRTALRTLLARYLMVPPERLRIACTDRGKPFLPAHPQLEFNVAHSGDRAVLAFSRRGPVGVDVERVDPRTDLEALASRCLSPFERHSLGRVPVAERTQAFFDLWTNKEAFVKALGTGLAHDLASFSTTRRPARLLGVAGECWALTSLDAGDGYAGALVVPRSAGPVAPSVRTWVAV